jgi:hypothetical protein
MFKKKLSLVKKITYCGLFLVFLAAIGSQPLYSGTTGTKKCELWVSFKGGFTYPYDVAVGKILAKKLCPNAIVDFEIRCGKWGFVIDVAYNRFRFDEFDLYSDWWSANTSVRYYFKSAKIRPFIYVGPGLYFPEEGNSRLGLRGGLGLHIPINDRWVLQLGTDFQRIFLSEDDLSFQHFHVGVDIRL